MERRIEWGKIRNDLGLTPEFVAAQLRTDLGTINQIEIGGEEPEVGFAEELAALYGIPSSLENDLAEAVTENHQKTLQVLFKSRPGGPQLTERDRAAMARVAAAAAEFTTLERRLNRPDRHQQLGLDYQTDRDYSGWPVGKRLAEKVRMKLGNSDAPVRNLLDLLWAKFGILVVPCELSGQIAAFSFADSFRGPTIVYNPHRSHENIWVLRFTLAHELCHLLFDRGENEPLGWYTSFDDMELETTGDPREVRANAFAIHFLMPSAALTRTLQNPRTGDRPEQTIRELMEQFGLNFKAMRLQLKNFDWLESADYRELPRIAPEPNEEWYTEMPPDKDYFPVPSIPIERRGLFAREIVRAWCDGRIDRGFLREILRAAPGESFEQLPGVYDLQAPSEVA